MREYNNQFYHTSNVTGQIQRMYPIKIIRMYQIDGIRDDSWCVSASTRLDIGGIPVCRYEDECPAIKKLDGTTGISNEHLLDFLRTTLMKMPTSMRLNNAAIAAGFVPGIDPNKPIQHKSYAATYTPTNKPAPYCQRVNPDDIMMDFSGIDWDIDIPENAGVETLGPDFDDEAESHQVLPHSRALAVEPRGRSP